ncbi:MAG: leucine-rich repeat protein, partial [Clostridia bacterium]|nr:leucine-rich repeat protein [Clostridia bacterium]
MLAVLPMGMFGITASAATTGSTGACSWSLNGTVLTITGSGKMADYGSSTAPWGKDITEVIIESGVTYIGAATFSGCTKLQKVTMADTVTSMSWNVFSGCTSLKDVKLSAKLTSINIYAFNKCTSLESIALPDTLKEIQDGMFSGCTSLKYVTLGNQVTRLHEHCFDNTAIENIAVPATLVGIDKAALRIKTLRRIFFGGTQEQAEKIEIASLNDELIGVGSDVAVSWVYDCCSNHTYTSDCDTTCNNCNWIRQTDTAHTYSDANCSVCGDYRYETMGATGQCTWYVYNKKLIITGNGAMDSYLHGEVVPWGREVTSLYIDKGVTEIPAGAFYNCSILFDTIEVSAENTNYIVQSNNLIENATKKVVFGCWKSTINATGLKNVTTVGAYAYYGTSGVDNAGSKIGLTAITLPKSVTEVETNAFAKCELLKSVRMNGLVTIGSGAFESCISLDTLTFPSTPYLQTIGDNAFLNCSALTTLKLPTTVKSIGNWAFYNCTALNTVTLNSGLEQIGAYAFYSCTALTEIAIPDTVNEIGYYAFAGCTELTKAEISDNVKVLEDGVFHNCHKLAEVTLPSTVTDIEENTFTNCYALTEVNIPVTLDEVWESAFHGCDALATVNYDGSQSDFMEMDIEDDNDPLMLAEWNYAIDSECAHEYDNACDAECNLCSEIREVAGHNYTSVTTDATCTENGKIVYTCTVCGDSYEEVIDAKGHTEVIDAAVDATCTTTGLTEGKHCSVCGTVIVAQQEVPALGHSYGDWVVDVAATTNKAGSKHRECSECGAKETEVIPMVFGFRGASLELQSSLGIIYTIN